MGELGLVTLVLLPIGLGLVGFLEPCSMGSNLLFTKYMEGKDRAAKLVQVGVCTVTRALFIGSLGLLAGLLGTAFLDFVERKAELLRLADEAYPSHDLVGICANSSTARRRSSAFRSTKSRNS